MDTGAINLRRGRACNRFLSPSARGMATGAIGSSLPIYTNSRPSASTAVAGHNNDARVAPYPPNERNGALASPTRPA
eukprot:10976971-Lingulodinium_polyedra.AAC.1